jgi:hypothetical protein
MAAVVAIPEQRIAQSIWIVRGLRVMLDADLAALYDVATKVLLQAVKRNATRFPEDFMFQLDAEEFANLRSPTVTSNRGGGATCRTSSPSRVWRCSPQFCTASGSNKELALQAR